MTVLVTLMTLAITPSRVRVAPGRNPVPATLIGSPISPTLGETEVTVNPVFGETAGAVGAAGAGAVGDVPQPRLIPATPRILAMTAWAKKRFEQKRLDMCVLLTGIRPSPDCFVPRRSHRH